MKFRFCRDCDCPDWLLAEIQTLAKIKSTSLQEFASLVVKSITGEEFDPESLRHLLPENNLDDSSGQASIAALRWILSNASGAQVEAAVLHSELQQLGLPKEQSEALTQTFSEQKDALIESLKKHTLRASGKVKWSYEVKGIQISEEKKPLLQLNIEGDVLDQEKGFIVHEMTPSTEGPRKESIFMTQDQLGALIYEMEGAYKYMKTLSNHQ